MLLPLPSALASGLSPAYAHEATASASSVPTVAYIDPASTNPYQIAFQCGIVQNAKAYGLKLVDIATNGTFTPQGQIPLLLAAAAKSPDVLITQPTSPTAITPTLKQVVAHGTKVVIYGQDLTDTSVASALVNQDNFGGGVALAKIVAKQTGGVGQALLIDYQPASGTSSERISGFISVMKKYPHFKLYGPFYDNYEASNDASILDAAIAAHPGLTMVVPSYNQAAENVVAALKAVGKAKKIKVYSFDGNPQEIQAVRAGDISVLLSEQVQAEAKATLSLAHSIAEGKKVPYLTNFPYVTITRQNINTPQAKGGFYGTKECM
jgi:ribose transport system substrate-binding protein